MHSMPATVASANERSAWWEPEAPSARRVYASGQRPPANCHGGNPRGWRSPAPALLVSGPFVDSQSVTLAPIFFPADEIDEEQSTCCVHARIYARHPWTKKMKS